MLGEAPGPVNFTQMVTLFAEKMAGGRLTDRYTYINVKYMCMYNIQVVHLYKIYIHMYICIWTGYIQILVSRYIFRYRKAKKKCLTLNSDGHHTPPCRENSQKSVLADICILYIHVCNVYIYDHTHICIFICIDRHIHTLIVVVK